MTSAARRSGDGLERRLVAPVALVDDPPDPAPDAVASRVIERDLDVADNLVVEIGDVESAVGPDLQVDGPEPGVVGDEEVGLLDRAGRRAVMADRVAVDAAGHHVADEHVAAILEREIRARVAGGAGDGRRAVRVLHHGRDVAEPVVRLAKAVVVAAAQQQHDRSRVAVGVEEVAQRVERHAERIDLPVGEPLDPRPVGPHAVGVAPLDVDPAAVLALDRRDVLPAVVRIDPAIEPAAKGVVHAVGVAVEPERAIKHLAAVGTAVAVGVLKIIDIREC